MLPLRLNTLQSLILSTLVKLVEKKVERQECSPIRRGTKHYEHIVKLFGSFM